MEKVKELLRHPMTVLFGLLIVGIFVWDICYPTREYSELENQMLAQKPVLSLNSLLAEGDQAYAMKYEKYVNEQFVLRDDWISLKSRSESLLGKTENNGVTYGKDGYLFEKFFSIDEERMEKNTGFVGEFGEKYAGQTQISAMLIPYSYEVLSDKMPRGLQFVDQLKYIEKIYEDFEKNGIHTLDLFPTMEAHKDEYIYYRTDHHWTTLGAYYAYAQFCQSRGLTPAALGDLTGHEAEGFYGTLFSKCKKVNTKTDTITYYDFNPSQITIDGEEKEGLYDLEKFEQRDKYGAFIHGNNGLTVLKSGEPGTSNGKDEPSRILVIKDSFGNCFAPYLLYNYDEVWVVDLRHLVKTDVSELMSENQFDDVLILYGFVSFYSYPTVSKITY